MITKPEDMDRQRRLYEKERTKLTQLPDADCDFIALSRASERYYSKEEIQWN